MVQHHFARSRDEPRERRHRLGGVLAELDVFRVRRVRRVGSPREPPEEPCRKHIKRCARHKLVKIVRPSAQRRAATGQRRCTADCIAVRLGRRGGQQLALDQTTGPLPRLAAAHQPQRSVEPAPLEVLLHEPLHLDTARREPTLPAQNRHELLGVACGVEGAVEPGSDPQDPHRGDVVHAVQAPHCGPEFERPREPNRHGGVGPCLAHLRLEHCELVCREHAVDVRHAPGEWKFAQAWHLRNRLRMVLSGTSGIGCWGAPPPPCKH
mmetsp:Transcript_31058/g.93270  ORF Transcript_31058/g.93270 Transcript_31058/m.93270 type:complete len:266 (-) Transcript_31058:113-910(-)